jgi:two-component system, LytTR family, response regulator
MFTDNSARMENNKSLTLDDKVLLCDGDDYRLVKLGDVRLFETCGNYTKTYYKGGKMLIYRTLSYLDERLPKEYFFRANRQYIVNLSSVHQVKVNGSSTLSIEMECGKVIALSRRRSQEFKGLMSL